MEKERLNYAYYGGRTPTSESCQLCGKPGADGYCLICRTCGKEYDLTFCKRCFLTGPDRDIIKKHNEDDIHCAVDLI